MFLVIQVLAWDKNKQVAGLNQLMELKPSDLQRQYIYSQTCI